MSERGADVSEGARPSSRRSRLVGVALILGLVAALLALPVGFAWHALTKRGYPQAVPASAFPEIDGVTVLSSTVPVPPQWEDSQSGNRQLVVSTADENGAAAFDRVTSGLVSSGWAETRCAGSGRARCFQNDEFFAVVQYPPGQSNSNVAVQIEWAP